MHISSEAKKSSVGIQEMKDPLTFMENSAPKKMKKSNPSDLSNQKIAVVGTSISGIFTALELQQKGFDVTLISMGSGVEGIREVSLPFGKVDVGEYLLSDLDIFMNPNSPLSRFVDSQIKFQEINKAFCDSLGLEFISQDDLRYYQIFSSSIGVDQSVAASTGIDGLSQRVTNGHLTITEWMKRAIPQNLMPIPVSIRASCGFGIVSETSILYALSALGIQSEFHLTSQSLTSLWMNVTSHMKNVIWNEKIVKIKCDGDKVWYLC